MKIFETEKGATIQEYTSPIDYPEEYTFTNTKPFLPSKNIDYKRGILLKEIVKNSANKILSEITMNYEFQNYEVVYGHRFVKPDGKGFEGNYFNSYEGYESMLNNYQGPVGCIDCGFNNFSTTNLPGYPIEYTHVYSLTEAYGWAKLKSKNAKSYFYENGISKITERNETFEYNTLNKKISQHTVNTEDGEEIKTKYFYHAGNSVYSQNRISEIEQVQTFKNGKLLETTRINYNNNWPENASYLPKETQTSFSGSPFTSEIIYDKYDSKGNLQQYTTKDGISTVIIWGYDHTQPIAKIEGAQLSGISQSLIDTIVNASNTDAQNGNETSEQNLISALDTFRSDASLSGYQISTYTYDPLIGVRSITPPSGIREYYRYDSANRLEKVIDSNKKVLKEFKYNYKN